MSQADTWIIVCERFHGAVGPVPTEELAAELAAWASAIGACTYRPVRLTIANGRAADGPANEGEAIVETSPGRSKDAS